MNRIKRSQRESQIQEYCISSNPRDRRPGLLYLAEPADLAQSLRPAKESVT